MRSWRRYRLLPNIQEKSAGIFLFFSVTVGFLHGEAGYVAENGNGILPDYERFYLGGINSLRGFDFQDICVRDEEGDEIGGDKYIQFNLEYLFPLVKQAGVSGVIFYDRVMCTA
jgi:outer membrane protein insertion porin family